MQQDMSFWEMQVKRRINGALNLEHGLKVKEFQPKKPVAVKDAKPNPIDDLNAPWPELVRVPIFGIEPDTTDFQFEWP